LRRTSSSPTPIIINLSSSIQNTHIMGKRNHGETPEERKERKRLKKSKKHDTTAATTTVTSSSASVGQGLQQQQKSNAATTTAAASPSLYYHKKLQLSVSMLPCGLRNVVESAKESIRPLLLKYCNPMGGILLAFDNVQVNNNSNGGGGGRILEELPHIHYDVTCNALVFCPTVGLRLDGTVVEASFHSHLSLLVHGHFNASISSNQMRKSGFVYDENMGQWFHVVSQAFLQQQQQQQDDNNNALEAEEDDENERSCLPPSRIQFTLHKLHEVGTFVCHFTGD
jgi:RPA43 OB domain in RNA Pol I